MQSFTQKFGIASITGLVPAFFVWLYGAYTVLANSGSTEQLHTASSSVVLLWIVPPLASLSVRPNGHSLRSVVAELMGWSLVASLVFLFGVTAFDELFGVQAYLTHWGTEGSEDGPFFAVRHGFAPLAQLSIFIWMSVESFLLAGVQWIRDESLIHNRS